MNQRKQSIQRAGLLVVILVLPFLTINVAAQTITIPVETAHNALVLQVNQVKDVNMIYYGKKLSSSGEYAQIPLEYRQASDYTGMYNSAYTPAGSRNLLEPAITVTHADGNNSLALKYVSHKETLVSKDVSLLSVQLKDPVYDFGVTLYYKSYFNEDVYLR